MSSKNRKNPLLIIENIPVNSIDSVEAAVRSIHSMVNKNEIKPVLPSQDSMSVVVDAKELKKAVQGILPEISKPVVFKKLKDSSRKMSFSSNRLDVSSRRYSVSSNSLDVSSGNLNESSYNSDLSSNNLNVSSNYLDASSNKLDISSNVSSNKSNISSIKMNLSKKLDMPSNKLDMASNKMNTSDKKLDVSSTKSNVSVIQWNLKTSSGLDLSSKELNEPKSNLPRNMNVTSNTLNKFSQSNTVNRFSNALNNFNIQKTPPKLLSIPSRNFDDYFEICPINTKNFGLADLDPSEIELGIIKIKIDSEELSFDLKDEHNMLLNVLLRTENSDITYSCIACDLGFITQSYLSKHLKAHNNRNQCLQCDYVFESEEQLKNHEKKHRKAIYKCQVKSALLMFLLLLFYSFITFIYFTLPLFIFL